MKTLGIGTGTQYNIDIEGGYCMVSKNLSIVLYH